MRWISLPKWSRAGIRLRLILIFLICFSVMASIGMLFLRASLIPSFSAIERDNAVDDMARVIEGFGAQLSNLEALNRDWANWDDMFRFVEHPTPAFIDSNLRGPSLVNSSLSLIMIFDRAGNKVGYSSVSPATGEERELGLFAPDKAAFIHLVLTPSRDPSCGILSVKSVLLLVCWRAILHSDNNGPSAGTLLMARDLDQGMLARIREETKLQFSLHFPAQLDQPGERWKISAPKFLREDSIRATRVDKSMMLEYRLIDLLDQPVASIRLDLPRTLMDQGRLLFTQTALQLSLIALATGVLLFAAMQITFIGPLARLQRSVGEIRIQKSWKTRIPVSRSDEIGLLGGEINGLLEVIDAQVDFLEEQSMTDPLTGLANRRAFDLRLKTDLLHAKRRGKVFSLMMLDMDFFKQYNDFYGHPAGDLAIQELAQAMRCVTRREIDMGARIGGEEFVALLPDTDDAGARRVAQALRAELARRAIPHEKSVVAAYLTVSIGIATSRSGDESPERLLNRVDQALYEAKKSGRDRIATA